jgi:ATP-dependent 26S proteasome regulatory subunit
LNIATVLDDPKGVECAVQTIYKKAHASLVERGVAIIDDLDCAVAPRYLSRNRTLVGETKGAGQVYNWNLSPEPAMLLKALAYVASDKQGVLIFSAIEDQHLAFVQGAQTVTLSEPTVSDYSTIVASVLGDQRTVTPASIFALHSQLGAADLSRHCRAASSAESVMASICSDLVSTSAVAPEEVESVDLAAFPGLGEIKQKIEQHVLFPLENHDAAAECGLTPKRGVLIHGPPGTGKTSIGRWLASRLRGKFFMVREMMMHSDIIRVFAAAQAAAPSVVFIDDADIVLGGWRPIDGHRGSDIFRFLLGRMDGLTSRGQGQNGDVLVVMTAQDVHAMADMLLRSGRIELWLQTKLPDIKTKGAILEKYIREDQGAMKLLGDGTSMPDVSRAAAACDRFCAADLRRIVADAKVLAAWAKHQPSESLKKCSGAEFLEKAAVEVRIMRDAVDASIGMYH